MYQHIQLYQYHWIDSFIWQREYVKALPPQHFNIIGLNPIIENVNNSELNNVVQHTWALRMLHTQKMPLDNTSLVVDACKQIIGLFANSF